MLAQDAALDSAATNHSKYIIANYYLGAGQFNGAAMAVVDTATGWVTGHFESVSRPGFTGVLPVDRALASGASYKYVGEVAAWTGGDCVGWFLNSVFHRSALLNTDLQSVGLANVATSDGLSSACVIDPGFRVVAQTRPTGWTGFYPGIGQTNVPIQMAAGEIPDPAPAIPNAQKGSPVSIYLTSAISAVNSFTLTPAGSTAQVPVMQITYASFPTHLTKNEAHILPTQLLANKTTYNVNFSATMADGTALNKAWSFTTL